MVTAKSNLTRRLLTWGTGVVVGHFFAVVSHLVLLVKVQSGTPRFLPPLLLLINLLPVAGLVVFAKGFVRSAASMITVPLGVALVIGIYAHFLSPGTDNVLRMAPGKLTLSFQVSAVSLLVLEALGCWAGVRMATSQQKSDWRPGVSHNRQRTDADQLVVHVGVNILIFPLLNHSTDMFESGANPTMRPSYAIPFERVFVCCTHAAFLADAGSNFSVFLNT